MQHPIFPYQQITTQWDAYGQIMPNEAYTLEDKVKPVTSLFHCSLRFQPPPEEPTVTTETPPAVTKRMEVEEKQTPKKKFTEEQREVTNKFIHEFTKV